MPWRPRAAARTRDVEAKQGTEPRPNDPYAAGEERYRLLRRALAGDLGADAIVATLKESELRGMGGAGFPTGQKWEIVAAQEPTPKYTICNADESEPGTFKDRQILAEQPHLVLEGMLLGMLVTGSEEGWVFIRHEYGPEEEVLRAEIEALRSEGLLGDDVLGSGRRLQVEIFTSPGGYILGEESALLECMEGHRGEPRNKPPFPGLYGLWGKPTLMNSVETFADVPIILERGAEWWKEQGVNGATGLKFFAVSGHVERPDVYCVRAGSTARDLIELAGGVTEGREVGAIQPGGASSNFLGPGQLDVPLDWKPLQEAGSMLGSGAVIVMAEGTDLLAAGTNVLRFFRNESCGKCVPCRVGSAKAYTMLSRPARAGQGRRGRPRRDHAARGDGAQDVDLRPRPGRARARAQRDRHGSRRRRGARAPEGPRRHRDVGRAWPTRRPGASSSPSRRWPRRWRASGRRGARRSRRSASTRRPAACRRRRCGAPHDLPGFARSTVDGYAVRAADTFGASEGLPSYLEVAGAVAMGSGAGRGGGARRRRRDPDRRRGAARRRRGGHGRAHAGGDAGDDRGGAARRAGRRHGARRRGRRRGRRARARRASAAAAGPRPARRGRRHRGFGPRAASGGDRVDRRRGRRRPRPRSSPPARSATRCAVALAALVREAGGEPDPRGIVPDDRDALAAALRRRGRDVRRRGRVGRLVGRRARRDRRRRGAGSASPASGRTASRCAPASRRCSPTAAACRSSGCRATRAPRWSCSGWWGCGVVRRVGGVTQPPPAPSARARLARDVPSAAGRLDIVQVTVRDGVATPLFGASALLSILTAADGYVVVPDEATGLDAGSEVDVTLYGLDGHHAVHPRRARGRGARRLERGVRRRRLPRPGRRRADGAPRGGRPGHGRAGVGDALVALVRRVGDGRHRRARGGDDRREREHAGADRPGPLRRASTPAIRCRRASTRS